MLGDNFHADIHEFTAQSNELDDDGDPMLGFYWQIMDGRQPVSHQMGPYMTALEAESACKRAWERQDYL